MNLPTGPNPPRIQSHAADSSFEEALRQSFSLLRRSLGLMLLLGMIFASVTLYLTMQMERTYKSTAQLMIERSATSPIEVDQSSAQSADSGYVGGQILVMMSNDSLMQVIERADLLNEPDFQSTPPSGFQKAISWVKSLVPGQQVSADSGEADSSPDLATLKALRVLKTAVVVEREGDTNVVSIVVRASSPSLAQRIGTAMLDNYIEMRHATREMDAQNLNNWIDARSNELRDQLTEAERAVTAYRIANNLIGDTNKASVSDQQLSEISAELIRARADLAQKRASYERFQQVRAENGDLSSLPEVQSSAIVMALRETLLDLQLREQDAVQIGRSDNARLAQIQRQLVLVEQQLDQEVLRVASVLLNETYALENRTRILTTALEQAGGQSGLETQNAVGLRELERVAEAYRVRYERYLNNAGVANELSTLPTNATRVVSFASLPVLPIYPPTKVFLVLSFLLGVGLALIIRLVRDTLSGEFTSLEQIERALGTKVLSVLPRLAKGRVARDVIHMEPFSPFSEAISVLRQNLRLQARKLKKDTSAQVVLITSAGESVGKTSIASSFAESASAGGQRVLLVDADLRFAGLSEFYNVDDGDGLCDILRGATWMADDATVDDGMSIIPAGDLGGRQPADCLASPHLGQFLNRARQAYDLVVIDGPPVANLADCKILADVCDQVAIVLHIGETTLDDMRGTLRQLPSKKIAGIIVNQVDPKETSAVWNIGGSQVGTYGQSAKLYELRNAAYDKDDDIKSRQIGRIA